MPVASVTPDLLPKPLQKHADPVAPLPLRVMGAKALVPAAPNDLTVLLYLLSQDPDEGVRSAATRSAESLPERIVGVALRDEDAPGAVLDWLADRLSGSETAVEALLLNRATPDATVARLAPIVPERLAEIIRRNELRLLRHDDIIRQLCRNPSALASTIDGACEFCVRNGLTLLDVPPLVEAHRRVHGMDPAATPAGDTAEGLIGEYALDLAPDRPEPAATEETPEQQERKLTIAQRIARMSVSQKIKLATIGNREARTILIRDSNKLVALASVCSPQVTDPEIMAVATSRTMSSDVLRHVYTAREYLKNYGIKLALVKNPKVPLPTALKLLVTLQERDIRDLARDRNVPQTIQQQAKAWIIKKEATAKGQFGGRH
jgi:hypothetical protein